MGLTGGVSERLPSLACPPASRTRGGRWRGSSLTAHAGGESVVSWRRGGWRRKGWWKRRRLSILVGKCASASRSRVSLCHAGMHALGALGVQSVTSHPGHALCSSFRSRGNGLKFPRILCVLDLEGYFWARYQFCRIYFKVCRRGAPAKILKKFAARPDFNKRSFKSAVWSWGVG